MATPDVSDLKVFLESSLNEIFRATVCDVLDSVDRTLSEYQGTIRRIESENEGLKALLFAQKSSDSAVRGKGCLPSDRCSFVPFVPVCACVCLPPPSLSPLDINKRLKHDSSKG